MKRTRPKYVSITTPNVVRPTMGRAKARKRNPKEMKPIAMPERVESSAARGVALRTRSAKGAAASSIIPEHSVATSPACQAMRAGSAAPAATASALAGSMMRNTCAIRETVLMPYGSAQTAVRPVRCASRLAWKA